MTEVMTRVGGTVAPGFEPVREAFQANFQRGDVGASCCVYVDGRPRRSRTGSRARRTVTTR